VSREQAKMSDMLRNHSEIDSPSSPPSNSSDSEHTSTEDESSSGEHTTAQPQLELLTAYNALLSSRLPLEVISQLHSVAALALNAAPSSGTADTVIKGKTAELRPRDDDMDPEGDTGGSDEKPGMTKAEKQNAKKKRRKERERLMKLEEAARLASKQGSLAYVTNGGQGDRVSQDGGVLAKVSDVGEYMLERQ
jgi:hypothetical protein